MSEHFGLKAGDRVYVNGERVDNGPRLADVIADADPVALDNIHTAWARESIARTILESAWLAAHDEGARDDTEAREVARQRLTALNVDGWRQEADHGCDGTEESCMATCPVAVQVRVSHDEIIDAVVDAFAERVRAAERERLAAAWEEVDGPDRVRRPPFRPFHRTPTIDIDEE